jgi:hypothetical protein
LKKRLIAPQSASHRDFAAENAASFWGVAA